MLSTSPHVEAYFDVLRDGALPDVFAVNAIGGLQALVDFQCGFHGRVYVTLGLFLVGLWLGKTRFFEGLIQERRSLKWKLLASIASAARLLRSHGVFVLTRGEADLRSIRGWRPS